MVIKELFVKIQKPVLTDHWFFIIKQKKLYNKMTAGCFSRNIRNINNTISKENENLKGKLLN
jgi:hypothetical protein